MRSALRTFALSLFLAVLGFSYALATSPDHTGKSNSSRTPNKVASRDIGLPLRFTNPFLAAGADPGFPAGGNTSGDPQGFDLGDAYVNEPGTRYLSAAGGQLPYLFTTSANFDTFGSNAALALVSPPPIPQVLLNGKISFNFADPAPLAGTAVIRAARFNAQVTDFIGTQRVGLFRINLFQLQTPSLFRFAQDSLPTAQLGNTYFTQISTLGATGTPTFSLVPGSVTINGLPQVQSGDQMIDLTGLEQLGLALSSDGTLFGRPFFMRSTTTTTTNPVTVIQFIVQANDVTGSALARNTRGFNQLFSLLVEDNAQANSEVLATSCTMSINSAIPTADTFSYNGVYDPKGATVDSLAGSTFTIRINGATKTGTFDAKGRIRNQSGLNVTLSPKSATIQVKIGGAELSNVPDNRNAESSKIVRVAATPNFTPIIISMEFKNYLTCDTLLMNLRVVGTKSALAYALAARRGQPLTGGMQILSAIGQDKPFFAGGVKKDGVDGDQWFIRFMGVPRVAIEGTAALAAFPVRDNSGGTAGTVQTGSVSATLTIGDDVFDPVTATINSNRLKYKVATPPADPGIFIMLLDGQRFLHSVQTTSISPDDTGIQQAIFSKDLTTLPLGLDVTGFSSGTSRIIAPNKSVWQAR